MGQNLPFVRHAGVISHNLDPYCETRKRRGFGFSFGQSRAGVKYPITSPDSL